MLKQKDVDSFAFICMFMLEVVVFKKAVEQLTGILSELEFRRYMLHAYRRVCHLLSQLRWHKICFFFY